MSVLVAMILWVALGGLPAVYLAFGILGPILIIFQHRDNIARLLTGTERKLGERGERR